MATRPSHVESKVPCASFAVRPLSPALGAEIVGVDLCHEIDDRTCAQIRDAWHEHLLILLRDQELSEEDQVRFAEKFGPPAVIHTKQFVRNHPAVMLISNIREDGKPIGALPDGEMHFHTDQCHQERPARHRCSTPSRCRARVATRCSPTATRPTRRCPTRSSCASRYDAAAMKRGTRLAD